MLLLKEKKIINFTNNSTQVLVKIRCCRTNMLKDYLKPRLFFTKWTMIIVLNDFVPFLLTNRKEKLYRNFPDKIWKKALHIFLYSEMPITLSFFSHGIPQLKTQGQRTHLTKIHPIHHRNAAAFPERWCHI